MNEKKLSEIAEKIYTAIYGNIDSKNFHASKVQEIYEWLYNGDVREDDNLSSLIAEWHDYEME